MKIIYIILIVLIKGLCYSQMDTTKWQIMQITATDTIWIEKPNIGDVARENGELKKAIFEYTKLVKANPTEVRNYYNIANAYSLLNNKDSALKYLAITLKDDSTAIVFTDPDFYNLLNDKRWHALEDAQIKKIEAR